MKAALALILGFAPAHDGYAQEYPAKPIRLIEHETECRARAAVMASNHEALVT